MININDMYPVHSEDRYHTRIQQKERQVRNEPIITHRGSSGDGRNIVVAHDPGSSPIAELEAYGGGSHGTAEE
jgi:hypothetical protein